MAYLEGVHLVRGEDEHDGVEALTGLLGEPVGLDGVLDDLRRRGRRGLAPGLAVRRALTWDARDRADRQWWPQGITGSHDATDAPRADGRRLLLVSWYAKRGADGSEPGSRLSVVDLATRAYEHVLLVVPGVDDAGGPVLRPLKVHAGGIVWRGDHVHVAATARGVLTCRAGDVLRVPDGLADLLPTHGHRYLLPVRRGYEARTDEGVERLRYSFLSLDRSTPEPGLLAGEYGSSKQSRRLVRYALAADGTFVADSDGAVRPELLDPAGPARMQGAVWAGGGYHATVSHGPWHPGSLYAGRPGALRRRRWAAPMGPEDLSWSPADDRLWSVSEHPRRRWVFAMARSRGSDALG